MEIVSLEPNPSMMAQHSPKPHDPRELGASPQTIQDRFNAALEAAPADLEEEAEMLSRAHDILHEGLQ